MTDWSDRYDETVGEHLLNPFGAAHGAVLASLVDHVLGSVVSVECDNDGRPVGNALGTIALAPPKPSAD